MALTAMDRCDEDGAQAYVELGNGKSKLLYCAHHYARHAEKLDAAGWRVLHDEREKLGEAR